MEAQLVDQAPDGSDWLHEIKYHGYRMHARLDRGAIKLLTRAGLDWTHKYPAIAQAVAALDARQAYLDDELCASAPPVLSQAACQDVGREFKKPPLRNTR